MKTRFKYSIGEMFVRLFKYAAPVKWRLVESTLSSIIGNLSHMGIMGFGAMFILICAGQIEGSRVLYGVLTAVCALLIPVCRYLEGVSSHVGAYQLLSNMRVHLFETIRRLAPACLMDRQKGDILSVAVTDIEKIEFFFAHTIGPMFTVIILPCTTLGLALHYSPAFALVLLPVYIIISIIIPLVALKAGRSIGMDYAVCQAGLKSLVLESVYGIKDLQIFGKGDERMDEVTEQNRKVNKSSHGLTMHKQVVSAAPTFFVYLARILILAVATYLASHDRANASGTIVISLVATASFSSTFSLTAVVTNLLEAFAAAERVFVLEDAEPQVVESENPVNTGEIKSIELKNVGFRYTAEGGKILDGLNLKIEKGEKIGIVGESGVGKSTVLRLLLRFWNPTEGEILINGINIKDTSLSELHRRIAVLEQDTFLFNASIADNIALGKPEATMDEIITAAKRAGIHDFIGTLPDGYDTQMGQMNGRLSGGERQRIGIARVMLVDPDVVVMDEPTSSLDVLHEKELLKTLRDEYPEKTVVIISHRMSTLSDCTRIVTLT